MSEHDSEREIARLFEAQREADEQSAPPFRQIVGRAPRRARTARSLRPIVAIVGALVVALFALLLRPASQPRLPAPAAEADGSALAAWTAPSDVLLETPGRDLLNQTPILASPDSESIPTLRPQPQGGRG